MTQTSQQKLVTGSDSGQVIAIRQKRGSRREHKLTVWFLGPFDIRDIHLGYRTFRGCLFLREEIVPFQKWNGSNFLPKTTSATDVTLATRVKGLEGAPTCRKNPNTTLRSIIQRANLSEGN